MHRMSLTPESEFHCRYIPAFICLASLKSIGHLYTAKLTAVIQTSHKSISTRLNSVRWQTIGKIITRVMRKGEKKILERRIIRNLPSVMLKFKVKLLNGITYLRGAAWIKIDSSLIVRSLRLWKRTHYWKSACKLAFFGICRSCGCPEATSSFLPATLGNALDSTSNKRYPVGNSRVIFDIDYMLTAGRSLTWTFGSWMCELNTLF